MQYITKQDLIDLGIAVNENEVEALLTHLNEQLEERVGVEITESLDDEKLAEFVELQETADDTKIGEWLQATVPELQAIVQDEIDILLGDLAENADGLTTAAQHHPLDDVTPVPYSSGVCFTQYNL